MQSRAPSAVADDSLSFLTPSGKLLVLRPHARTLALVLLWLAHVPPALQATILAFYLLDMSADRIIFGDGFMLNDIVGYRSSSCGYCHSSKRPYSSNTPNPIPISFTISSVSAIIGS